jgi:precorrin-2 dehydrogenase/sirohydrochlorin ferrochelatase
LDSRRQKTCAKFLWNLSTNIRKEQAKIQHLKVRNCRINYRMIPLFVDLSGRQVVVFGGGEVAARKAGCFSREADVLMVSRSFSARCRDLPIRHRELDVKRVPDDLIAQIVGPAFLVVAALSDPEQNNRIGAICREKKVLFNNADGESGDVMIPAVTQGDRYQIAISTGGESPAISRFLRQEIETRYPSLAAMIDLQHRLREALKQRQIPQAERKEILWKVITDRSVWKTLDSSPARAWSDVETRYLHA